MLWLKEKVLRAALVAACAALSWPAYVCAQAADSGASELPKPRVLLLDSAEKPRVGLFASLRIQLADSAQVQVRHELRDEPLAARIQAATQRGQKEGWLLIVWSDEPTKLADGSQEAVLYGVGQREGRALLQVVHVPGGEGPDMDRTLAIKVHEVVSELQRASSRATAGALQETGDPLALLAVAKPSTPAKERSSWLLTAKLSALLAPQSGTTLGQWGAALHAGPAWQRARMRVAARLGIAWFPAFEVRGAAGRVSIAESLPELELEVAQRASALWLSAHAALGSSFIDAEGRTPSGARADASELLLTSRLGVGAELPLASGLGVRVGIDLQLRAQHRRFAVNRRSVADFDVARPLADVSLTYTPD